MVENEHSPDFDEPLKISIGAITKYPEILRFTPYHIKLKKMCKHAAKKNEFCNKICS